MGIHKEEVTFLSLVTLQEVTTKRVGEQVSEWMSEWMSERVSKWLSEWVCEWVSEWVSEYIYKRYIVRLYFKTFLILFKLDWSYNVTQVGTAPLYSYPQCTSVLTFRPHKIKATKWKNPHNAISCQMMVWQANVVENHIEVDQVVLTHFWQTDCMNYQLTYWLNHTFKRYTVKTLG